MKRRTDLVDTSGYSCPINLAIVSRKLKTLDIGDLLEVVSDDPQFKRQIKTWSYETGNHLVDFKQEKDVCITRIRKGAGFRGETLVENIKFIALGIKLHFIKALLRIVPLKKIQYLGTGMAAGKRNK